MALFRYEAFHPSGEAYKGTVQATDIESAKSKLNEKKILFSQLALVNPAAFFRHISQKDVLQITELLHQLLIVGLPLYEALITLEEEYSGDVLHSLLSSFAEEVRSGSPLSEAMNLFPSAFPPLYRSMVAAGEMSGDLAGSLQRVADMIRARLNLKAQLIHAFTYPGILAAFSSVVVVFMLLFIIPTMAPLFEGRSVGLLTKFVLGTSHLFVRFYIPILPLTLGSVLFLYWRYKRELFVYLKKGLCLISYFKSIFLGFDLVGFSGTVGLLLEAGVDLIRALELAEQVVEGKDFKDQVAQMRSDITIGKSLSNSLIEPFFPKRAKRLVRIGEETGALGEMLLKISELYRELLNQKLLRMTTWLQPAILIFMGAVVGLIIISVLLPLTDVSSLSGI